MNTTISSFVSSPIGEVLSEANPFGFPDGESNLGALKVKRANNGVDGTEQQATKRSKTMLGAEFTGMLAHVIEETMPESSLLMNDEEFLALSDALTDSSDSFDEESGESADEFAFEDEEVVNEDGTTEKKAASAGKKTRGNYACSKCGLAKRGHICAFQPRLRRRAGGMAPVMVQGALMVPAGLDPARQQQLRIAKVPVGRCDMAVGPSTEYVFSESALPSRLCSTGTQCELEAGNAVRDLYLDAQGFPESYAQGILADPGFNVATAKTITVSRPIPKSYKPRGKLMTSCGVGPDSATAPSSCNTVASALPVPPSIMLPPPPTPFPMPPLSMPMPFPMAMPPMPMNPFAPFDPLSVFRAGFLANSLQAPQPLPTGLNMNHLAALLSSYPPGSQMMPQMPQVAAHSSDAEPSLNLLPMMGALAAATTRAA